MLKYLYSFLVLFLLLPFAAEGAGFSVVINEIAWIGTINSANDEWIELYNNTKNPISLEGWILESEDGSPEIKLSGEVLANSFYLLERTNDDTAPGIAADLIYKGALGNTGEFLKLYDNFGNLIDEADCSSGWFAGDNKTKQTMERINPLVFGNNSESWQTSRNPGGTPKAQNSAGIIFNSPLPISNEIQNSNDQKVIKATANDPKAYPAGIVFSEILPSPEGSDAKEEWIEIFNENSFEVDISGWKIEDVSGKTTAYAFPKDTKISAQGFLVLTRETTKIVLNNDADGLSLVSPDSGIVETINYRKAPRSQSYNRGEANWFWSRALTPGATNIAEATPKEDRTEEGPESAQLAAAGSHFSNSLPFFSVFLIAFFFALFSGTIILILKERLKTLGA